MPPRVAIAGTGYSPVARHAAVPLGALVRSAITRAAGDAGIDVRRIDGLCVEHGAAVAGIDGVDFVSARYLAASLALPELRWSASLSAGSFVGAVVEAVHAVANGACSYAVAWKAMRNPSRRHTPNAASSRPSPPDIEAELLGPYGLGDNVSLYAMPYSRYLARYGAQREQMAAFIVNNRKNAAMNPEAVFFGQPVSEADYLASRMIVDPLSLLDCDMPVDGCGAVIVTSRERAADGPGAAAYIAGHASFVQRARATLVLTPEQMYADASRLGRVLWGASGLGPGDVGQANLYDGFSWLVYLWLEGLGFCGEGEAPDFIQDGRIAIGGELPLNTSGGSLGMGRLHGPAQVIEAVRQIQGRCGPRQVRGVEVTLAVTGQPSAAPGAMVFSASPDP